MTVQQSLFDPPPEKPDEIREGSPAQWIDRVNRDLCAHCGDPRGEPHPDADNAVNHHLKNHLCRPCFEADRDQLQAKLDKLHSTRAERTAKCQDPQNTSAP